MNRLVISSIAAAVVLAGSVVLAEQPGTGGRPVGQESDAATSGAKPGYPTSRVAPAPRALPPGTPRADVVKPPEPPDYALGGGISGSDGGGTPGNL